MNECVLGFNGERPDTASGATHLGNGYRAYNPVTMRFNSPDNMSPFGRGGVNPYLYCTSDPANGADPSGHNSLWGWIGIAAGVVLGGVLTPISAGASLAATLSAISVAMAVVSTGLAISQQLLEVSNPKAAAALGWAALGTGIVSGLGSTALSRIAPKAKSLVSLFKGIRNRPFGRLMMDDGFAGGQGIAEPSGQFRNPRFIGIYPAEESAEPYMALSFTDRFNGHARLNVVGPASMGDFNRFGMGSGGWNGSGYGRIHLGYTSVGNLIRDAVAVNQEIRIVQLAVPYAARLINRQIFRSNIIRDLRQSGVNLGVTAPTAEYSVDGPAADMLNSIMTGLSPWGEYTAGGQQFNPQVAQGTLNLISYYHANTPNAFRIAFDLT